MKQEETQQLSCTGNLKKALPHQPLPPPFIRLIAKDSSAHRLVSFAIGSLTDAFLNHKVDQMVLIDYEGERRKKENNIYIYIYIYISLPTPFGEQFRNQLC